MRRLGLACVALIALSACNGAPTPIEPKAKDSDSSATPSPGATSTLKPPELPAAAKRNDETGAANFVAYWVRLFNFASHTGETGELRALTDESCDGCESYFSLYERTYAKGGYFEGSDWKLSNVTVEYAGNRAVVRARVTAPEGEFRTSGKAPIQRGNDEDSNLAFGVRWSSNEWRMAELGFQNKVVP